MRELLSLIVIIFSASQVFSEGYWLLFPVVVMPLAIGFLALSVYERLHIEGQWFRIQPQVPTLLDEDGEAAAEAETGADADRATNQTAPADTAATKTTAAAEAVRPPDVDDFAPVDLGDLDDFFKKNKSTN